MEKAGEEYGLTCFPAVASVVEDLAESVIYLAVQKLRILAVYRAATPMTGSLSSQQSQTSCHTLRMRIYTTPSMRMRKNHPIYLAST